MASLMYSKKNCRGRENPLYKIQPSPSVCIWLSCVVYVLDTLEAARPLEVLSPIIRVSSRLFNHWRTALHSKDVGTQETSGLCAGIMDTSRERQKKGGKNRAKARKWRESEVKKAGKKKGTIILKVSGPVNGDVL